MYGAAGGGFRAVGPALPLYYWGWALVVASFVLLFHFCRLRSTMAFGGPPRSAVGPQGCGIPPGKPLPPPHRTPWSPAVGLLNLVSQVLVWLLNKVQKLQSIHTQKLKGSPSEGGQDMMPGILSSHALVAPQGRGSTLGVGRHEPHHSLFHEVPSQGGGKQPHTGNVTERDGTGSPPPPVSTNSAEERSANNSNQTLRLGTSGGIRRPRCRGADVGGPSPP